MLYCQQIRLRHSCRILKKSVKLSNLTKPSSNFLQDHLQLFNLHEDHLQNFKTMRKGMRKPFLQFFCKKKSRSQKYILILQTKTKDIYKYILSYSKTEICFKLKMFWRCCTNVMHFFTTRFCSLCLCECVCVLYNCPRTKNRHMSASDRKGWKTAAKCVYT